MDVWIFTFVAAALVGVSLLQFTAKLKPIQGWGVALGVVVFLIPWLPEGKYGFGSASYEKEKKAEAKVIAATNDQFNALVKRVAVLDSRLQLLETPSAPPAKRQAVAIATVKAKRDYAKAATTAAAARQDYIRALPRFDNMPACCDGEPGNSARSPDRDIEVPMDDDPVSLPGCCTAVVENSTAPSKR